jgi:hypothetical protein
MFDHRGVAPSTPNEGHNGFAGRMQEGHGKFVRPTLEAMCATLEAMCATLEAISTFAEVSQASGPKPTIPKGAIAGITQLRLAIESTFRQSLTEK